MTPKARQRHLVALKKVLTDAGFRPDSYGNFKYPDVSVFRIKFKANNLRMERKLMNQWKALESKVWSQLTIEYFTKAVESMKKRIIKELPRESKQERVSLAPALDNPAKVKQMETIIDKRNFQDYQCYMLLVEMRDAGLLLEGKNVPADMEDALDIGERARTAISNRIELNDKFMRLMAGVE